MIEIITTLLFIAFVALLFTGATALCLINYRDDKTHFNFWAWYVGYLVLTSYLVLRG